jgi:hypothetical protein
MQLTAQPAADAVTLRLVAEASVPEFTNLYAGPVGTVEYLGSGQTVTRNVTLAGLFAVDGTRDVATAVRALNADLLSTSPTNGAVTAAVLQAKDGALYGARALASTNLASIGPMPLDEIGFSRMPFGAGSLYDPAHVAVTAHQPQIKGFVGYTTWVDTATGAGGPAALPVA